jgi:hypothetical protein
MAARTRSSLLDLISRVLRRSARGGLCAVFLAGLLSFTLTPGAASPGGSRVVEGSNLMSPTQTIEAGQLSPNLVPTFSDPSASMVVAKVMALEPSHAKRPNVETGLVVLTVIEVIHSEILRQNDSFSTPFERISDPQVRLRNRFNAWNALSLVPGDLLLLAVNAERPSKTYASLAAAPVSSPNDPQVAAAVECYRMERALREKPPDIQQMLARALESGPDLTRSYVLDLLTRRKAFSREYSASILESAVNSGNVPPNSRPELGFQLVSGNLFDENLGADPVNVNIVSALAKQMVNSTDRKSRDQWLGYLSSCVSREYATDVKRDREMRFALVKAVRDPGPQQVISALHSAIREASDADDAKPAKRLLETWQAAVGPRR